MSFGTASPEETAWVARVWEEVVGPLADGLSPSEAAESGAVAPNTIEKLRQRSRDPWLARELPRLETLLRIAYASGRRLTLTLE